MRDTGIPISQQPTSQYRNASGMEYRYEVSTEGGGTKILSVQQQTLDSSHINEPHWEAEEVKLDEHGKVRMTDHNRPKLKNEEKKKAYCKPSYH